MSNSRAEAVSRYMAWAKLRSGASFNLAVSGVVDYPLAELPVHIEDLEIGGTGSYGYKPLMERLAAKAGVPEECVVYTLGTSMANFVALAALVHPGDEVLIEKPTYDPLLAILDHLGARVSRFERRAEKDFRVGLGELESRITPDTRLVVLCNLHNPSSVLTDDGTLRQVGEMSAKAGARVLVDEVYLETLFDQPWRSAFHLGPNFVITSSLTKAYGLSGIRCGWILAQPELVRRMWEIVDFTYGSPVHPAERLAVIALDHLDRVRSRARALLETNRPLLNKFLALHPELDSEPSRFGTTVFPRLKTGNAAEFVATLREKYATSVVPGEFFEAPQHFRIGFCGTTETVSGGLERMEAALKAFQQAPQTSTPQSQGAMAHRNAESPEQHLQMLSENLNLTDDQKTKLKPILEDQAQQIKAVHNDTSLSQEQKRAKIKSLHESFHDQINAMLTPEQQVKFKQLRQEHMEKHEGMKEHKMDHE